MLVKDIIEKLNSLPQNLNLKIKDNDKFSSNFEIKNGNIVLPLNITKYEITLEQKNICDNNNTFLNDVGMVCDMLKMTKAEFLKKYFYITGLQYDMTKDIFYSNKQKYIQNAYDRMIEIDVAHAQKYTKMLEQEIEKMQNIKKCKLF